MGSYNKEFFFLAAGFLQSFLQSSFTIIYIFFLRATVN